MTEQEKLEKAVDDFAEAMKERLRLKNERYGFTGWSDKNKITHKNIVNRLFDKSLIVLRNPKFTGLTKFVDIANFAMFLWYRNRRKRQTDPVTIAE